MEGTSHKRWLYIAIILGLGIGAYFLLKDSRLFKPAPPPPPEPIEAETIEEIEAELALDPTPLPDVVTVDNYEEKQRDIPPFSEDEHWYGNHAARYTLVWYSSMTSTLTRVMHPEVKEFIDSNDNVSLAFRHFPISDRRNDWEAARVSECVAQDLGNEAFFLYLEAIATNKSLLATDVINEAVSLGMDRRRTQDCSRGNDLDAERSVLNDKQAAWLLGKISSSPTFVFVDNETLSLRFIERAETRKFMEKVLEVMEGE